MPETEQTTVDDKVYVDLDNLEFAADDGVEIDPDKDPFEKAPPPPDGWHKAKISIQDGSRGFQSKVTKPKEGSSQPAKTFLTCRVNFQIIAEGEYYNNFKPNSKFVNTLVFEGKSEMAAILTAALAGQLGNLEQAKAEVREIKTASGLAKRFAEVAAAEPFVSVKTLWVGQYKSDEIDPKTGKEKYVVAFRGQKAFPSDGKGGFRPVANAKTKAGAIVEVIARAEVIDVKAP